MRVDVKGVRADLELVRNLRPDQFQAAIARQGGGGREQTGCEAVCRNI